MMRTSQKGIALILTLILVFILSVMAISLMAFALMYRVHKQVPETVSR